MQTLHEKKDHLKVILKGQNEDKSLDRYRCNRTLRGSLTL